MHDLQTENVDKNKKYMHEIGDQKFRCTIGCNEMDGYIYVCDGAYLRAVNTLFTISIGLSKLEDSVIKYLN